MNFVRVSGFVILLGGIGLLWPFLVVVTATLNRSDAAGNGLSYAYGVLLTIVLWVLLALLLLAIGLRHGLPKGDGTLAVILVPLAAVSAVIAVHVIAGRAQRGIDWPTIVPLAAPLLVLSYCAWVHFPTVRTALPPRANQIIWGTLLLVSMVPIPFAYALPRQRRMAMAAAEAREAAEQASRREANIAAFHQLTPASPLAEWLSFVTGGNELRNEAFTGIRGLPGRQQEAEGMIAAGVDLPMMELRHLGLAITPRFCEIANAFFERDARSFRPSSDGQAKFDPISYRIDRHLFTMRWLIAQGCDCSVGVAAYDATARLFPASPEQDRFLASLDQLRQAARRPRR